MRKYAALTALVFLALMTMGSVNLQTTTSQTPVADLSQTIQSIGQYGLLAWLIIRSEGRIAEQQRAWREERKWLMEQIFKLTGGKGDN
jgi:hypothetical protein